MSNSYTKFTVTPAIPCDLLCGLAGHLLMGMLDHSQNVAEKTMDFYSEEGANTSCVYDDDLLALIEAEPESSLAIKLLALNLGENDEFDLSDANIDFADLLAALSAAHPEQLPRIEVEGACTGDRCRPGEQGGFAHIITPTGVRSMDTSSFLSGVYDRLNVVIEIVRDNEGAPGIHLHRTKAGAEATVKTLNEENGQLAISDEDVFIIEREIEVKD